MSLQSSDGCITSAGSFVPPLCTLSPLCPLINSRKTPAAPRRHLSPSIDQDTEQPQSRNLPRARAERIHKVVNERPCHADGFRIFASIPDSFDWDIENCSQSDYTKQQQHYFWKEILNAQYFLFNTACITNQGEWRLSSLPQRYRYAWICTDVTLVYPAGHARWHTSHREGHSCTVTGQFNQVSPEHTGIGYGYKVVNKLKMPTKKKKTTQRAEEETKDVDDEDSEDQEPKPKKKSKQKKTKTFKEGEEEGYKSDTSGPDVRRTKDKGREKEKVRKKKKKAKEEIGDELSSESQNLSSDNEDNNNGSKSKKRRGQLPDVIEATKKGSKTSLVEDKMGSKDKKSKNEDKKSKKDKEEDPVAGDEEEGKKKKKEKKKKGSVKGESDEDTKKTKGKKKKVENYVEIYENELRNYEPEKVENYEDEYHKKKGE
ncbi:hypothetical protein F2P81_014099 [Scophthalmus maximus]|uniref:Uncharacterized protein n=1 Tax=Scophthalmus maximus TaxID=52904 RepID=A0A6A4SIU6_SCOMX|nr:hypothetical protein F2P81_014099 [Scophthalmus maximus]